MMQAVTSITFFFVADVKCGLYEINKNNEANAIYGLSPVQETFRDRTKAMLDRRRGPGPGPGPVPTNQRTANSLVKKKKILHTVD